VPVLLWHGAADTFSPLAHTQWLAGRIHTATVQIDQDAAHFAAFEVLPRVLAWLTEPQDTLTRHG
jgi:pimeloyl-ACP methyl ester carboxylesterase